MATPSPSLVPDIPDDLESLNDLEKRIERTLEVFAAMRTEVQFIEQQKRVLIEERDRALRERDLAFEDKAAAGSALVEIRAALEAAENAAADARRQLSEKADTADLEAALTEVAEYKRDAEDAQAMVRKLTDQLKLSESEVSRLTDQQSRYKSERQQVRQRVEKLLGQMDLLTPGSN